MINLTCETTNSSVELYQITKITIAFEENLNYQFDKWQTIYTVLCFLVLIIISASIIILLLRK